MKKTKGDRKVFLGVAKKMDLHEQKAQLNNRYIDCESKRFDIICKLYSYIYFFKLV